MEDKKFKVIIVEDVKLELKGTEEIFRHEIPNAEVIGTAMTEQEFWTLIEAGVPDLVLLDLGLGGSTTIGVDICRNIFKRYPGVHVLIFTGEILNEKLWVDVLEAGADGIILKTGDFGDAIADSSKFCIDLSHIILTNYHGCNTHGGCRCVCNYGRSFLCFNSYKICMALNAISPTIKASDSTFHSF